MATKRRTKTGNGEKYHEGEMMGRLIAINEDIREYNKRQTDAMETMCSKMAEHDVFTRTRLADIKEDYTHQLEGLRFLFKWIILPLIAAVVGIKVLELTKVLP